MYEVESLKFAPELLKRIKLQYAVEKDPEAKKEFEYLYGDNK